MNKLQYRIVEIKTKLAGGLIEKDPEEALKLAEEERELTRKINEQYKGAKKE